MYSKWNKTKILLIIDDIDRCDHNQILNIIESLKLLLEQQDINERVQILILVDEEKLDFSIKRRFQELIEDEGLECSEESVTAYKQKLLQEHKEKLITSHLGLTPLTNQDREKFIKVCLNFSNDDSEQREEIVAGFDDAKSIVVKDKGNSIYSQKEIEHLLNSHNLMENFTPRQIRLFFIKYQLCRIMVRQLPDIEATHEEMIDGLLNPYTNQINNEGLKQVIYQIQ